MATEGLGIGDLLLTETVVVKRDEAGNVIGHEVHRTKVRDGVQYTEIDELDNISIA